MANLANAKRCKNPEEMDSWQIGTHLTVLSKSLPMDTNTDMVWVVFQSLSVRVLRSKVTSAVKKFNRFKGILRFSLYLPILTRYVK